MTTQNIFDLVDTWNAGGTTFTAVKMNVTDTASAAASLLMDLQVGSVSAFNVSKGGSLKLGLNTSGTNVVASNVTISGSQGTGSGGGGSIIFQVATAGGSGTAQNELATALTINSAKLATFESNIYVKGGSYFYGGGGNLIISAENNGFGLQSGTPLRWGSAASYNGSFDTYLYRDAAGVIGVRGTSTSAGGALSFIEQTAPAAPAANGVRIYAEDNGSGKTRLMALFNTTPAVEIAIEP